MNEIAAFFLVMFGCSDDLLQCRQLPAEPVRHVSAADCEAQVDTALMYRGATADYPTIIADCMSGTQLAALKGGTIDFSKPVPVLIAQR